MEQFMKSMQMVNGGGSGSAGLSSNLLASVSGSIYSSMMGEGNSNMWGNDRDPQNNDVPKNTPTEDKGGIIDNFKDFFAFMLDKAINMPEKEVSAFKISDNVTSKTKYFVLPWKDNDPETSSNAVLNSKKTNRSDEFKISKPFI
jgi:hypothetical protein